MRKSKGRPRLDVLVLGPDVLSLVLSFVPKRDHYPVKNVCTLIRSSLRAALRVPDEQPFSTRTPRREMARSVSLLAWALYSAHKAVTAEQNAAKQAHASSVRLVRLVVLAAHKSPSDMRRRHSWKT